MTIIRPIRPTLRSVRGHSGEMNPYTTPARPEVAKNISNGHLECIHVASIMVKHKEKRKSQDSVTVNFETQM